jgi:hypothetical protein
MHIKAPQESFLDKSVRVAQQGVNIMGTLKGAYEVGKTIYGGVSAAATMARPLLALM